MDKLFKKRCIKLLNTIYRSNFSNTTTPKNFHKLITKSESIKLWGYKFIHLLPKSDLALMSRTPCPVREKEKKFKGINNRILTAAKKLRKVQNIKEKEVCRSCILSNECHLKDKSASKKLANTSDLSLLLYSFAADVEDDKELESEDEFLFYLSLLRILDNFEWILNDVKYFGESEILDILRAGDEDMENWFKSGLILKKIGVGNEKKFKKGKMKVRVRGEKREAFVRSFKKEVADVKSFLKDMDRR